MSAATAARPRAGRVYRMGDEDLLTLAQIAELLGVQVNTAQVYHKRATRNRREGTPKVGDLPVPDATFGRTPTWREATIRAWIEARPGVSTEAATEARRKG